MKYTTKVFGLLCLLLFVGLLGFSFVSDGYTSENGKSIHSVIFNLAFTLLGVSLTVLVIDELNERRASLERKRYLLRDLVGCDEVIGGRAIIELNELGALHDGTFVGANIPKVNLDGIDLTHGQFSNSIIYGGRFSNCDFGQALLSGAQVNDTVFNDCSLEKTNFKDSKATDAIFKNCDMRDADFTGANLKGSEVIECRLSDATRAQLIDGGASIA